MIWRCGGHEFTFRHPDGRPRVLVMGILNVTPDSFSDGGRHASTEAAVAAALSMAEAGADLLDIGGESTRPGAPPVSAEDELARVLPVIEGLRGRTGAVISIDTSKAAVARAAIAAGAEVINDVTALRDPELAQVAALTGAGVVLMHMRGTPQTMQQLTDYADVVAEVRSFLQERLQGAHAAGIESERLAVDPGIGFSKTLAHNLELFHRLAELRELGRPVLIGASRKAFIGKLLGGADVTARLEGTAAAVAAAVLAGSRIVRVHDVAELVRVVRVAEALAPPSVWE